MKIFHAKLDYGNTRHLRSTATHVNSVKVSSQKEEETVKEEEEEDQEARCTTSM